MKFSIKESKIRIRRGDRFKVINTKGLNGLKMGEVVYCNQNSNTGTFVAISLSSNIPNSVTLGLHVEKLGVTKEDIKNRLAELNKEKEDLQNRMNFMENKSIDELDERRYITYIILKEINKNSPAEDKEEVINDLLERGLNEYITGP